MDVASGCGEQEAGEATGCGCKEVQWNLIITVTVGPNLAGCYIEVAFLLSGIQNHHN